MSVYMPFCVLERPFVVWAPNVEQDRDEFLEKVDADFYLRTARMLIGDDDPPKEEAPEDPVEEADDQGRKDIASLARLLWHHGIETLVMLLGAYMQAPGAPHAYFLKCRTEDAVEVARLLRDERRPTYSRLSDTPFTLTTLLNGIHLCAGWADRDDTVTKLRAALCDMLASFLDGDHRSEYNSIKHGLRTRHGSFALAVGIQETPGVAAPPEAMQMMGNSRDASFFAVARPLANATNQQSKVNFRLESVTVPWSLEKTLCDLQLLSVLIGNIVSALRIAGGAKPNTVQFRRPAEADEWWERYRSYDRCDVTRLSSMSDIDARALNLLSANDVHKSYRRRPGSS